MQKEKFLNIIVVIKGGGQKFEQEKKMMDEVTKYLKKRELDDFYCWDEIMDGVRVADDVGIVLGMGDFVGIVRVRRTEY